MTDRSRLIIEIDSRRARTEANRLSGSLNRVSDAGVRADRAAVALSRTLRTVGVAAAGFGASIGVDKVVRDLGELQQINSRLSSLTGDLAGQQQFLTTTTNETSASYRTLADGYSKLLPLYKAGLLTISETRTITKGLADVQAETGASAADLGRSIFGLSQGLSAGTLRAEELNQVTEAMPGLLQALDKAAGQASGGFRKLVNDGKVTSDFFRDTLIVALQDYEGAAARLSGNITQTFNRTGNAYLKAVEAFESPVAFAATEGAEALASAFKAIEANAETIVDVIQVVGVTAAVALGGQAAGAVGRYSASLFVAAQQSIYFANAEKIAATAAQANSAQRVLSAQQTEREAAVRLRAAIALATATRGTELHTVAMIKLAAAEQAAATATGQLAAASTAATTAQTRLAAATAATTIAGRASAVAMGALSGVYSLLGGPAGLILIAAGALAYFALRQTDADRAAKESKETLDALADAYFSTGQAAQSAGDLAVDAAQAEIDAINQIIDKRKESLKSIRLNAFADFFDKRAIESAQDELQVAYDKLDSVKQLADEKIRVAVSLEGFDAQFAADGFDLIADRAEKAQLVIDKLFDPDKKKREELQAFSKELQEAYSLGAIDESQNRRAQAEINTRINQLGDYADRLRDAEQAANKLQAAVDDALPDSARISRHTEQMDLLEKAYARGGKNVQLYGRAIDALQASFDKENADKDADSVREYTDAIERLGSISDPFSSFRTDIQLLETALDKLPNKASEIGVALANLDYQIRAELTVVESTDNAQTLQNNYARQLAALEEFQDTRNVSEAQATQDVIALAKSYADEAVRIAEDATSKVRDFIEANSDIKIGVSFQADFEAASNQILENVNDPAEQKRLLQQLEAVHQQKLTELVRSGEATRTQVEQASAADRYANFVNTHQEIIDLAGSFAQEIVGAFVDRENDQARQAATEAQKLAQEAADAQQRYEENGTEANRVAAQQAQERAKIADDAARREFEQAKKAQIAQATISASLAIVNALASGGNIFVGLGMAALVAAQTARQIANIRRTEYNSPGVDSGYGGGSNSNGTYAPDVGQQQAPQPQETIIIVAGTFNTPEEAVAEGARNYKSAVEQGYIFTDGDGQQNFQNVPSKTSNVVYIDE